MLFYYSPLSVLHTFSFIIVWFIVQNRLLKNHNLILSEHFLVKFWLLVLTLQPHFLFCFNSLWKCLYCEIELHLNIPSLFLTEWNSSFLSAIKTIGDASYFTVEENYCLATFLSPTPLLSQSLYSAAIVIPKCHGPHSLSPRNFTPPHRLVTLSTSSEFFWSVHCSMEASIQRKVIFCAFVSTLSLCRSREVFFWYFFGS